MLILSFIISGILVFSLYDPKPDIHTAKHYELVEIQSIGDSLATDIIKYLNEHENAVIDDLSTIKGIGEKRIKLLKGEYND